MSNEKIIVVTGIEDFDTVDIIEVLVAPGDAIEPNQSIVTLESDKVMMEFPATDAGIVKSVRVAVGDKIKQGDPLLVLELLAASENDSNKESAQIAETPVEEENISEVPASEKEQAVTRLSSDKAVITDSAYASPAVRKYAGELGINLETVAGTAVNGRILKHDVQSHVKNHFSSGSSHNVTASNTKLPDFSEFGEAEEQSLNKLRQVSAKHLSHAWNVAPHVTQFDNADITELEIAREQLKEKVATQGAKLTLLPFVMKALVKCLAEYPDFNSSLNQDVTALIHKKYFHIGVAVDTPRGLVVPVIRDVDQKKTPELAKELMEISARARDNKLTPKEMQGGCMTITSLGGIGGQHFTPIINYPEVAILGVSRTSVRLAKQEDEIIERLMLPLSLSYDHRAIDGVAAAKFITSLKNRLSDVWSLMI